MSSYEAVLAHVVSSGRVLLGRNLARGLWTTFGGKPEREETVEQTLFREIAEELGIVPTAWRRLADRNHNWYGDPARIAVFVITDWEGTPQNRARHEHAGIAWYSAAELSMVAITKEAKQEALRLLMPTAEEGVS